MTEPAARLSSTSEIKICGGPEIIRGLFVLDMWMPRRLFIVMLALSISAANAAQRLDQQTVEKATLSGKLPKQDRTSALLVKVEVLLDRAHFSPGQIDGHLGENVTKALAAYAEAHSLPAPSSLNKGIAASLSADTRPILTQYVLTDTDLSGPFTEHIPARMEEMKGMKWVGYRNAKEALAEKFHVSEQLLALLNPGAPIDHAGETIVVPNVLFDDSRGPITRIEVDSNRQTVRGYGKSGDLVAFYPPPSAAKKSRRRSARSRSSRSIAIRTIGTIRNTSSRVSGPKSLLSLAPDLTIPWALSGSGSRQTATVFTARRTPRG